MPLHRAAPDGTPRRVLPANQGVVAGRGGHEHDRGCRSLEGQLHRVVERVRGPADRVVEVMSMPSATAWFGWRRRSSRPAAGVVHAVVGSVSAA